MRDLFIDVMNDGALVYIHDDCFTDLQEQGHANICRASHVEATATGKWIASMRPAGGPDLGPYRTRREALRAEKIWLHVNWDKLTITSAK